MQDSIPKSELKRLIVLLCFGIVKNKNYALTPTLLKYLRQAISKHEWAPYFFV